MDLTNLCVSLVRIGRITGREQHTERGISILRHILSLQNTDGSWNEVYPHLKIDTRSTLATAYVGYKLVSSQGLIGDVHLEQIKNAVIKAAEYVEDKEITPGYFLKSDIVSIDTVNVNMVCSIFFLYLYHYMRDPHYLQTSLRGLQRVAKSQRKNGAFPYYTSIKSHLVPIAYHAFITRLLAEYYGLSGNKQALLSLNNAVVWLVSRINMDGSIKWEDELGVWTYRIFSSYGSVLRALLYASNLDKYYYDQAKKVLRYVVTKQAKEGFFPTKDYNNTRDVITDIRNAIGLIKHQEYLQIPLLLKMAFTKNANNIYERLVFNIQLLEALTSCLFT